MGMTIEEAIRRIDEHNYIHRKKEPRAVYITEAFDTLINIARKYQKIEQLIKSEMSLNNPNCNIENLAGLSRALEILNKIKSK